MHTIELNLPPLALITKIFACTRRHLY